MKVLVRSVAVALLAAAVAVPAGAQQTEASDLHAELVALNGTMVRIAGLLERQLEGQKIELVMVRVRITLDRMQRTEDELRAAEAERASLEDEKDRLLLAHRTYFESPDASENVPVEQLNRMREQFDANLKRLEARLRDANRRAAELEGQLVGQQTEVQEWQDFADRLLAAL